MSLRNTINKSLEVAWKQLKDLAVLATLTKKPVATFDFSTGQNIATVDTAISLKVVILEAKSSKNSETTSTQVSCIFKTKDTGDLGLYDELLVGTTKYRLSNLVVVNNSFIVTADLEKL